MKIQKKEKNGKWGKINKRCYYKKHIRTLVINAAILNHGDIPPRLGNRRDMTLQERQHQQSHMTNYSQKLPSPVTFLKQTLIIKSLGVTATRIYRHPAVTFTVTRMPLDIKYLQQKVTGDGKNQQKKEDVAGEPVTSSM